MNCRQFKTANLAWLRGKLLKLQRAGKGRSHAAGYIRHQIGRRTTRRAQC